MKLCLSLLALLAAFALACDSEDAPEPTTTTQDSTPAASATAAAPEAATPTSAEDGGWDESAVWQDYYESEVFSCLPSGGDIKACVLGVAEDAGVAPEVSDFIEENEAVLVTFQELGAVDYGEVSWVAINMGRPEPVFLNGEAGPLYYGTVVPEDWREADTSYEAIEMDALGIEPYPWAEYSQLVSSDSDASGQRMTIETVIQACRACGPVAFLALEVAFDAEGALSGVTVLPMRCDPEAEGFQGINVVEGPCAPP